ncbi:alanine racemase [Macrococcus carouselicus]|uniref:Pyridoxal-dependent decarboxylase, pyridoxal-binding domain protein n=1 Tax=Macrococcus carouselicus TaxID=69969 RepID=A0A9Q8CKS2_9STAP|nr:alanine racemase [Macrococcus carouselicus]TDM02412.1 pyridoxal-dependent decarboxylase, pyridoxal-binding domain protein [Macrococcus carouselicus]
MMEWNQILKDREESLYIYDLSALKKRAARLCRSTKHQIYYAVKANADLQILTSLLPYVAGFEVASPGEIMKVRSISETVPIIYGGPVKTRRDLETALRQGVVDINIESLYELDELIELSDMLAVKVNVQLRINLKDISSDAKLKMAGTATQFGLPEDEIDEALKLIQSARLIELRGFHFHAMSNNLSVQAHLAYVQKAFAFTKCYRDLLPEEPVINIGGGFGIDYAQEQAFPLDRFLEGVEGLPVLTLEIGRWLTAPVGYYAAKVYDIKTMHGRNFVLVNGGTYHFRFPKAWYHEQPYVIVPATKRRQRQKTLTQQRAVIAGKLCTPNDVFGPEYPLEHVSTDDYIVFKFAGAYGLDISHIHFLSHAAPEIIYI